MTRLQRLSTYVGALLVAATAAACFAAPPADAKPLTMVVMDPLAAPLACDCVKGYAQRKYEKLAEFLEKRLGRPVKVVFGEDLAKALRGDAQGQADLVIGKQSLVKCDALECRLSVRALAMLTDKEGATTITGLFVVAREAPAQGLADLKGYRILFGKPDSAEKHAAALLALKHAGVPVGEKIETREGCSDAAIEILEHQQQPGAAVISSYAIALLEGCGTVEKGSLRVIGRTAPVPFVTVFAADSVTAESAEGILKALLAVREHADLLVALESKQGFVAMPAEKPGDCPDFRAATRSVGPKMGLSPSPASAAAWPGWRGPGRDGLVPSLPEKLPAAANIVWKKGLTGAGLAGIAATERLLIVADRDPLDCSDIFRCLLADTGAELWQLEYPALGKLDYGNSPRATPLVHEGNVYLLGAFGDLHCVKLADGEVLWKKNIVREFAATLPKWGMCASPLVVDDKLIVNPGARDASLAALDRHSGKVVWRSAGPPAAYASFIVGRFGSRRQIVGYDAISLGGWDPESGKRLWTLIPPHKGDFNVPTPIDVGGKLLVATENNGTRLYDFDQQGAIVRNPLAAFLDLAPDSSTPVVVGNKVFGCHKELFCLETAGLRPLWAAKDKAFDDYVSIIASRDRLLITTVRGELLLVGAGGERYHLISRLRICDQQCEILSHPALVGSRLYLRDGTSVWCVALDGES